MAISPPPGTKPPEVTGKIKVLFDGYGFITPDPNQGHSSDILIPASTPGLDRIKMRAGTLVTISLVPGRSTNPKYRNSPMAGSIRLAEEEFAEAPPAPKRSGVLKGEYVAILKNFDLQREFGFAALEPAVVGVGDVYVTKKDLNRADYKKPGKHPGRADITPRMRIIIVGVDLTGRSPTPVKVMQRSHAELVLRNRLG